MTSFISPGGTRLLDRIAATRPNFTEARRVWTPSAVQSAPNASPTPVTLGKSDAHSAVYSDPRSSSGVARVWSSPVGTDDTVSAVMARNRNMNSYQLADQWRGLGGASLTRFGKTGESYSQTLVDDNDDITDKQLDALTPQEQTQRAADVSAREAEEFAGVASTSPRTRTRRIRRWVTSPCTSVTIRSRSR